MMTDLQILEQLERKDISFKKAMRLLSEARKPVKAARGHFLRIHIRSEEERFKLVLPLFMLHAGLSLGRAVMNRIPEDKRNDQIKKLCETLNTIQSSEIRMIFRELKQCKSYGFMRVRDGNSDVEISIV